MAGQVWARSFLHALHRRQGYRRDRHPKGERKRVGGMEKERKKFLVEIMIGLEGMSKKEKRRRVGGKKK